MTDLSLSRAASNLSPLRAIALAGILWSQAFMAPAQGDALESPALPTALAEHALVLDITKVGNRLFAVGERGHIIWADDTARPEWNQSEVPVRVTLTGCYFINTSAGWAVGHDGVVLKTDDGGSSWHTQLNGFEANRLAADHATRLLEQAEENLADASPEEEARLQEALETAEYAMDDASSFLDEGASRPLLDVWFKNEQEGLVVGAFGLILRTTDGGKHWLPWFDHLNNSNSLHLNSISKIGETLYITGEAGAIFQSPDDGETWQRLESPYDGSLFGILGNGEGRLVVFGLRGNVFQSSDAGNTWARIDTGTSSSLFGGTLLTDGSAVLVGTQGITVFLGANGQVNEVRQSANRLPLSQVIARNSELLTTGLGGIQAQPLTARQ